ncbi:MAG: hypothetical protein KKC30_15700 [Proteobacteria bacterium]|nr:hypothetical protein [Pseudomonadota bacterium]MBU4381577.1 hypothetical protein [Pseudomonadota bacterium]MCG2766563.1 mediator of RNA polymerase II transcription subunit 18 [Desulfarculaceae bacterium]
MKIFGFEISRGQLKTSELPPGGRSSDSPDNDLSGWVGSLWTTYQGLQPYDPTLLGLLERLSLYSPIVGQAVKLLAGTVNTGHDMILEGPERQTAQAQELIGNLARTLYRRSAGVDGLVNHYTRQVAVTGALASEDVLEPDFSGIRQTVLLPVSSIRFKLKEGEWEPQQKAAGRADLLELNPHTFAYYALDTLEGHPPYGLPPFISVIEQEDLLQEVLTNLRFYAKKLGLYGIVDVGVPAPERQAGESQQEYQQRAQNHLNTVAAAYDRVYKDGLLVHPDNHQLGIKNVSGGAYQVGAIIQNIEQLMMNALGIDPAMFGRSFSTTETYAGVVYNLLLRSAAQYQRLIKRRMERTYRLALALAGLWQVEVSLQWNPQPELKPDEAASAEQTRVDTVIKKAERGIIDPDQAAQELGYEKAADPERLLAAPAQGGSGGQMVRLVLSTDGLGGYRRPRLTLAKGDDPEEEERALQAEAEGVAARYTGEALALAQPIRSAALDAVEKLLAASPELAEEEFVSKVHRALAGAYGQGWAAPGIQEAVTKLVEPIYRQYRLLSDLAGAGRTDWTWGGAEQRVLNFSGRLDQHFFSKYLDNDDARRRAMRVLKEQWLDKGAGLFGRADPEAITAFRAELDQELRMLDSSQIQRITDTTVQRLRNWANVQQLAEAGATWATVWAILDGRTSAICREMHGRKIKVAAATAEVDYLSGLTPDQFESHLKKSGALSAETVRAGGVDSLATRGQMVPPYHVSCRTRLKLSLEPPPEVGAPPEDLNASQERSWRYWEGLPEQSRDRRLADLAQGQWRNEKTLGLHARVHPEVAADLDGYRAALSSLQAKPDRIMVRLDNAAGLQMALAQGDKKDWRMAIVDLDQRVGQGAARVKTFFGSGGKYGYDWSKQRARLAAGGWVEI